MAMVANSFGGSGLDGVIGPLLSRYGVCRQIKFVCNRSTGAAVRTGGKGTADAPYASLATALADGELRANSGDGIVVLPGHSENVTDSTTFAWTLAGIPVICLPAPGSARPTFRWTATGGQWALNKDNSVIHGALLRLEGANGVTKAINVTAAEVALNECEIEMSSGASNKAAIGVEVGAGANRFAIRDSFVRGVTAGATTDGFKVVSAVTGVTFERCKMQFSSSATNGLIHFTAAALNCYLADLRLHNTTAASQFTVVVDAVASEGAAYDVENAVMNGAGGAAAQGFSLGAGCLWRIVQGFTSDEAVKNAILSPGVST